MASDELISSPAIRVERIFVSPGHNFFGRHGLGADTHEIREIERAHCMAGRGIEGDRFFDYKADYKGQATFFSSEVHVAACDALGLDPSTISPSVYRRNFIVSGVDLNALIGVTFAVQGVRFEGTGESTPCYWMNEALGPGTEDFLKGRGGLRARILSDGWVETGAA